MILSGKGDSINLARRSIILRIQNLATPVHWQTRRSKLEAALDPLTWTSIDSPPDFSCVAAYYGAAQWRVLLNWDQNHTGADDGLSQPANPADAFL